MTPLPLVVSCQGDLALHLIPVTEESQISDIINASAQHVVGVRIPGNLDIKTFKIRRINESEELPKNLTAKSVGIKFMEWLEIYHDD